MTMYLPITEVHETGAEVDEFLDVSVSDRASRPAPSTQVDVDRTLGDTTDPDSSSP